MLCSEFQIVKPGPDFEDIKPLPCNRWSCEYCGPRRRSKLVQLAASGHPNKILTLTVNPAVGSSPVERRALLHDAWKRLVKRILRHFKWKSFDYMAFIEKTVKGEPHLHILLRCGYIPQRWISSQMKGMLNAPIVWIEQVKGTAQAIRYVTKYVGKAPAQFGTGKRYWVSRRWRLDPEPETPDFEYDPWTMRIQRARWSEVIQERTVNRYTWGVTEDGWVRFWRPGTRGDRSGLVEPFARQEAAAHV